MDALARNAATDAIAMACPDDPVTIKRYASRQLYHPAEALYLSLGEVAAMVRADEDFVVFDAHTGEDVTRSVLKRIIVEQVNHG